MQIITKQIAATAIPRVSSQLCRVCKKCAARDVCETKAIIIVEAGELPWVDASRCFGCRRCVLACPWGAIAVGNTTL